MIAETRMVLCALRDPGDLCSLQPRIRTLPGRACPNVHVLTVPKRQPDRVGIATVVEGRGRGHEAKGRQRGKRKGRPDRELPHCKVRISRFCQTGCNQKKSSTHAERPLSTIEQAGILIKRSVRRQDCYPDER